MNKPIRILGIDPAIRKMGYGIVESNGDSVQLISYGVINGNGNDQVRRLRQLYDGLFEIVQKYVPEQVAMESVIFVQNRKTAIDMGAARGVALLLFSLKDLPVFEYSPRTVKIAATGRGSARKEQVSFMVRAILSLNYSPPADAADALAVALAHVHNLWNVRKGYDFIS
ncbi:crossover junction endodeoxyribonuclease RuvC [Candidatus Methylacidiphilum fumarolicum]|uniref:Crossover junction endodeoxyribonuclease RuvC n=2 Tax=Candidatus Methylacidiphilum fumarolicum TaxID=591154 RepID=I0JVX4_METFB|nr:crossover junction endodeoxyribonuclease RuvC [Candidatus Methylacidiphilum fumarolicum]MBW6415097.1 crossover junction endodeoxyribonuclease RuvC [Candidatus Methylacidiphilum fumarolicum]TFE67187.1 crossover junction endodeoxyribonuclease RuvC [Candidatus Methylacidiphilum fumarolicum]TFE72117.1 crossover junction endodeoxyribonuclease RuvC [Candidatus Methylacidiphilum fumarolicum]TFE73626.1 crossover junction endodeoxyribonuclease RuvC [Candidatus Methylacidiphilum fumarolicum]TFE76267.